MSCNKTGRSPTSWPLEKFLGTLLHVSWLSLFSCCFVPCGHLTPKNARRIQSESGRVSWETLSKPNIFPFAPGNIVVLVLHDWFSDLKISKLGQLLRIRACLLTWEWGLNWGRVRCPKETPRETSLGYPTFPMIPLLISKLKSLLSLNIRSRPSLLWTLKCVFYSNIFTKMLGFSMDTLENVGFSFLYGKFASL